MATPLVAPFSEAATKSDAVLFAAEPKVLCANTSVPITRPKFVLASAAVVAPVPPLATATVPFKVFASAATVISALPSNGTPLIFFGAASFVAVLAFPVIDVRSAILAFKSSAVCVAIEIGLLASEVLSTLPSPIIALSIPDTVPVKVGLLMGALSFNPVR